MKNFYSRLAVQGIQKNRKIYLPYIITCIAMAMMYYIVSYLTYSKSLYNMHGGRDMQMILSWGTTVIAVFAVIFLFYTNSFIIRNRKKEYGLYNILGMGKKNIAMILVWETLFVFFVSAFAGIGMGILFSKLTELCAALILGENAVLGFTVEINAVKNTILLLAVVFSVILLHSLGQIHLSRPIELLHSVNKGEKPPKARWLLAAVGIVMLAAAYYMSCTIEEPLAAMAMFFIAVILVIMATYLLFTVGSVVLCKALQKNKKYYYQTRHFVSVSSMAYRMKRNGASLASICVLSTMVLVIISSTFCLFFGEEDALRNLHQRDFALRIYPVEEQYIAKVHKTVSKMMQKNQLEMKNLFYYQCLPVAGYMNDGTFQLELNTDSNTDYSKIYQMNIFTIDEYNRLMNQQEKLSDGEIMIYTNKKAYPYDELTIAGFKTMKIKKQVQDFIATDESSSQVVSTIYIFVSGTEELEKIYEFQKSSYGENSSHVQEYYGFDLDCDDEKSIALSEELLNKIKKLQKKQSASANVEIETLAADRESFYSLYGGLFFLGILLSIVFVIACVLIVYYKQITEGYEDAGRFEIMQKVGMTKREIQKSVNSQILTVFFAPLLMAGCHVAFAFPMISKLLKIFGFFDLMPLIWTTAGAFLVFAIFYALVYKITSKSYYKIVSRE